MAIRNIYTFESTHFAMMAEKTLEKNGIPIEIAPVPREISASCGIAIIIKPSYLDKAEKELAKSRIIFNKHVL